MPDCLTYCAGGAFKRAINSFCIAESIAPGSTFDHTKRIPRSRRGPAGIPTIGVIKEVVRAANQTLPCTALWEIARGIGKNQVNML
jgi:hypothetical protein